MSKPQWRKAAERGKRKERKNKERERKGRNRGEKGGGGEEKDKLSSNVPKSFTLVIKIIRFVQNLKAL